MKLNLGASIRTAETDTNPANNRATTTIVVPADKPATGTLTGQVWNDRNHNGRQDKGENGVAGARILVTFGPGDSVTKTYGPVTTNASGWYTIRGITPNVPGVSGFTFIAATPDKSWSFTKYLVGAARGNSDFQYVDANDIPGTPYEPYLGKDAVIGISDQHAIKAGQTLRLDAGLVRTTPDVPGRDTGSGEESLPKTGAAAGGLLGAGVLLVCGGIALTVLARRRRSTIA